MQIGSIGASALSAFSLDMSARANNLANVNTDSFKAQSVHFMDSFNNSGVSIGDVVNSTNPGPMIEGRVMHVDKDGDTKLSLGFVEGSNTDVGRELTAMLMDQRGFEANAKNLLALDDMHGAVLNMMV